MLAGSYQASLVMGAGGQRRASRAEVDERRAALVSIVSEMHPMTVRQVFYQATVKGIIDKTEAGYNKIQTDLVWLRRSGEVLYEWIADNTRFERRPQTYSGIGDAIHTTAQYYRRSLWHDADRHLEIWLEKDALAGVVIPVTFEYDVPLKVSRGYASLSFLHEAGTAIGKLGRPAFIYHLGDFDPSGVDAAKSIEAGLREYSGNAEIVFERLAVTPGQITAWSLPTRPTKTSDTRAKAFGHDLSVELDAIAPEELRELVETAIQRHLPEQRLLDLRAIEQDERDQLLRLATEISP